MCPEVLDKHKPQPMSSGITRTTAEATVSPIPQNILQYQLRVERNVSSCGNLPQRGGASKHLPTIHR